MPFPCVINKSIGKGLSYAFLKKVSCDYINKFYLVIDNNRGKCRNKSRCIQNSESKLEQNAELINQKETEQKMILTELQDVQSGFT